MTPDYPPLPKPSTTMHAALTLGHLREFVALASNQPENTNIEILVIGDPVWQLPISMRAVTA